MRLAALAVVGVVVVGCISIPSIQMGDPRIADDALVEKLEAGTTTKKEVEEIFGPATNVDWTQVGEKWRYDHTLTSYQGAGIVFTTTNTNLHLLFDDAGVLQKFHRGGQTGSAIHKKRARANDKRMRPRKH